MNNTDFATIIQKVDVPEELIKIIKAILLRILEAAKKSGSIQEHTNRNKSCTKEMARCKDTLAQVIEELKKSQTEKRLRETAEVILSASLVSAGRQTPL